MPGNANSGGRNRKSQAEHAITGTGRKDRGTAPKSPDAPPPPDPPKGRPPIPIGLVGPALEEWGRMVIRLEAAKTLSTVDDAVLYQYCCLFAETEAVLVAQRGTVALLATLQAAIDRWNRLVDRLSATDASAETYTTQIADAIAQVVQLKKIEARYPTALRQGHMALRQYLVEFGMTPAARGRVSPAADATPAANPLERFTKTRVQ